MMIGMKVFNDPPTTSQSLLPLMIYTPQREEIAPLIQPHVIGVAMDTES